MASVLEELEPLKDRMDQTNEEQELVKHVRSKVEEIRAASNRIANESIWMTNIAYVCGFDGITYNSQTRQYEPINRAQPFLKKDRIHVNKILPTLQNRAARLLKSPPRYDVRPESQSQEDKDAARLGIDVINNIWDKQDINTKRTPLIMWLQECGHAYMKTSWDDTLGKEMIDPETGEMDYEGDIRVEPISPFEVFPNPLAKSFEEVKSSWLIHARVRPLDYFKLQYPERGHLVKEESVWLLSLQYEQRINNMNSRGSTGDLQFQKNVAIEMIKYEARSKKHPNGRMIICANGVLLADKELPAGEIPFAKFDDIQVAGKYYPESVVTHLRPIQDQFNTNIRKRAEWTKKLLAGKYVAARGSGIAQEALNDQSGELLYYTPVPNAPGAGQPTQMQIPMMPNWAFTETDYLEKYFSEVSGLSEVSQGQLPSASIPAIGLQLLLEQDETRIGIMTDQHERSWARLGYLILKYVEKFYVLPRKLKIAGPNRSYMVKEFTGADLRGNTDVYVVPGSTVPNSKAVKRQDILNAYSQGLLGDPADPQVREKVLGLLEYGDIQGIWEDYALDMQQIKRGMEKMKQGILIEVSELDNHTLWIQEINRFRKTEKFQALPEQIQAMMLEVLEQHLQFQMQLSGQMPPPPPPPVEAMGGEPQVFDTMSGEESMMTPPDEGELLPGEPLQ